MDSKEWLEKKGIHPTEPIYWEFVDSTISLDELLEEYALYKQLQNTSSNSDYAKYPHFGTIPMFNEATGKDEPLHICTSGGHFA